MGAIGKIFDKIGDAIKHVCEGILHTLEAAVKAAVGAFKAVFDDAIALVKAIASGNLKEIGNSLLALGGAIAEVTQPELLAADVATQAAMTAVKEAVKTAAHVCGFNSNQAWMKDALGALSVASNFTSVGNAAKAMGTEVLANVAGEKGPLQSEWESMHPREPEDENYKRIHERSKNQNPDGPTDGFTVVTSNSVGPAQGEDKTAALTIGN